MVMSVTAIVLLVFHNTQQIDLFLNDFHVSSKTEGKHTGQHNNKSVSCLPFDKRQARKIITSIDSKKNARTTFDMGTSKVRREEKAKESKAL